MKKITILVAAMFMAAFSFGQMCDWGPAADTVTAYAKNNVTAYRVPVDYDYDLEGFNGLYNFEDDMNLEATAIDQYVTNASTAHVQKADDLDFSADFKAYWDDFNLYLCLLVSDESVLPASDQMEVFIASYADRYEEMFDGTAPEVDPAVTSIADRHKLAYGRWHNVGAFKLAGYVVDEDNDEIGLGVAYPNFVPAWDLATGTWSASPYAANWSESIGVTTAKATNITGGYKYIITLPMDTILQMDGANIENGTQISFDIRVQDADGDGSVSYYNFNSSINDVYISTYYAGYLTFDTYMLGKQSINKTSNEFSAYPNPSKDVLKVKNASKANSYVISNIVGQEMLSGKMIGDEINVSSLSNGMYMLKITDLKGNAYSQKIVKK